MRHAIASYLDFLRKSTNEHGVHSPFVFELVTKCFYDRTPYAEYRLLNDFRKSLLADTSEIEITDFGAGSKVFTSNKRQVSKIARTAGITPGRARLLFRLAWYFKPGHILELGTSVGLATSALSMGNQQAHITSIEGCRETASVAKNRFDAFGLKNIELLTGEFESVLAQNRPGVQNMVYFDGNHQKDATLRYFELLLPTAQNDSVWIFDDIHWSRGMSEAWETIKNNPKVTVTIDTFQWGLVFFRSEQQKEHFAIRV